MAKKKEEPDVRQDASGRELYPWEVSPEDQAETPLVPEDAETPEEPVPGPKHNEN